MTKPTPWGLCQPQCESSVTETVAKEAPSCPAGKTLQVPVPSTHKYLLTARENEDIESSFLLGRSSQASLVVARPGRERKPFASSPEGRVPVPVWVLFQCNWREAWPPACRSSCDHRPPPAQLATGNECMVSSF